MSDIVQFSGSASVANLDEFPSDQFDLDPRCADLSVLESLSKEEFLTPATDALEVAQKCWKVSVAHDSDRNRFIDKIKTFESLDDKELRRYFPLNEGILSYNPKGMHHKQRLLWQASFWLTVVSYEYDPRLSHQVWVSKDIARDLKLWILYPERLVLLTDSELIVAHNCLSILMDYYKIFAEKFMNEFCIHNICRGIIEYMEKSSNFPYSHVYIANLKSPQVHQDYVKLSNENPNWAENKFKAEFNRILEPNHVDWRSSEVALNRDINSPYNVIAFWHLVNQEGISDCHLDRYFLRTIKRWIFPLRSSPRVYQSRRAKEARKLFFKIKINIEYKSIVEAYVFKRDEKQIRFAALKSLNKVIKLVGRQVIVLLKDEYSKTT